MTVYLIQVSDYWIFYVEFILGDLTAASLKHTHTRTSGIPVVYVIPLAVIWASVESD